MGNILFTDESQTQNMQTSGSFPSLPCITSTSANTVANNVPTISSMSPLPQIGSTQGTAYTPSLASPNIVQPQSASTPFGNNGIFQYPTVTQGQATQPMNTHMTGIPNTLNAPIQSQGQYSHTSPFSNTTAQQKIEPRQYSGLENEDIHEYLLHFETVCDWNKYDYTQRAQLLIMKLAGEAQKVILDIPPHLMHDYMYMKSTLIQRFSPKHMESAYRCEFRNRRRKHNETVKQFGQDLRTLAHRAFHAVPIAQREFTLIDQFITGLGNFEMQKHIQFQHPQSFDQALAIGIEYEALVGQYQSNPHIQACNVMQDNRESEYSEITHMSRKIDILADELRRVQYGHESSRQQHYTQGYDNHDYSYAPQYAHRHRDIVCTYCNKTGHIENRCYAKQRDQNMHQNSGNEQ